MLVNEQPGASQADSHILHPGSRALFKYWDGLRGAEACPRREALRLQDIRELVPNLVVIERVARPADFRWRLAGTALTEIFRHELTGHPVLEGWQRFERDVIARFLSGAVIELQPSVLRYRLHTDGGQMIGSEFLVLPMRAQDGSFHIFGGMFAFRDIYSLGYKAIAAMDLAAARGVWSEHIGLDEMPKDRPFRNFQVIPGGRA